MTKKQYETLRHCLGLDRHTEPYRNYYAGEPDAKVPNELVDKAMMLKSEPSSDMGGLCYYQATNFGKEIAMRPFSEIGE